MLSFNKFVTGLSNALLQLRRQGCHVDLRAM